MDKKVMLWGVIAVLFVVTIFLTFKAGEVGAGIQTVQAAGDAVKSAAPSYGGMVGGC